MKTPHHTSQISLGEIKNSWAPQGEFYQKIWLQTFFEALETVFPFRMAQLSDNAVLCLAAAQNFCASAFLMCPSGSKNSPLRLGHLRKKQVSVSSYKRRADDRKKCCLMPFNFRFVKDESRASPLNFINNHVFSVLCMGRMTIPKKCAASTCYPKFSSKRIPCTCWVQLSTSSALLKVKNFSSCFLALFPDGILSCVSLSQISGCQ